MKTSFTRLFVQPTPEPQTVIEKASAPAEMPSTQMDAAATRALLRRAVEGIFRVQMNLCGVSGEDVEPVGEPTKAGDGASLLIRTPVGMVKARVASDGSGTVVVQVDPPPPEPEHQAAPPAAEESPEPDPRTTWARGWDLAETSKPDGDDAYPPAFAMLGRTPDGRLVEAENTGTPWHPSEEAEPVNPTEPGGH